MRFVKRNLIANALYHFIGDYPSPSNLSYFWSFGFLSLFFLGVQIITGIFLAMHYVANSELAFFSVDHIMRDVNFGWVVRYLHSNGASMFFLFVYIHIFRGLFFSSFVWPRYELWGVGVIIFFFMIITAFMGYVLPWGQMSFWAATVITNLVSAIPFVGTDLVQWIWGGFSVGNATLNRFFSLHYLFPFLLLGLVILHFIFLHEHLSNNPIGVLFKVDRVPFSPYMTIKDLFSLILFSLIFLFLVFFYSNFLGHPDNFIQANSIVTPLHIVPEWYLLPFYAILRSVPNKLGGVFLLIASIFVLYLLPFYSKVFTRSSNFRPFYSFVFWFFLFNFVILGWIGGNPIEYPFFVLGQVSTFYYFFYLIFIIPVFNFFEREFLFRIKFK